MKFPDADYTSQNIDQLIKISCYEAVVKVYTNSKIVSKSEVLEAAKELHEWITSDEELEEVDLTAFGIPKT